MSGWEWRGGHGRSHLNKDVTGVCSKLNSATGTPRAATMGANPAAGYTTEEVPTFGNGKKDAVSICTLKNNSRLTNLKENDNRLIKVVLKCSLTKV